MEQLNRKSVTLCPKHHTQVTHNTVDITLTSDLYKLLQKRLEGDFTGM